MDVIKYRKLYLCENWNDNCFKMVEYYVDSKEIRLNEVVSNDFQRNHPKVLCGEGYWITNEKLCLGYEMISKPEIYRPIFSHKLQRLLDKVNLNIINPYKFWNKLKLKYFMLLVKMYYKRIPIECIKYIVMYIN